MTIESQLLLKEGLRKNCLLRAVKTTTYKVRVAPHAGAWIETFNVIKKDYRNQSPPMRGRGLKLANTLSFEIAHGVAPHAGAWIETLTINTNC